jgi:type II secretory pathway component PulM
MFGAGAMRTARRNSLRINLSKRELKQLLLLAIFMVLALLYGLYIGWWSLHKEEEEHTSKTFSELRAEISPSASPKAGQRRLCF